MSCFSGKMREYPSISVDCFTKENLDSKAYFLSHCHKDHMEGLDSSAFANRINTSKQVFVYCSDTTRNLLLCDATYVHLKHYLRGIPLEQPYIVSLHNEQIGEVHEEAISVTLLSAGHCVGSVMFLFEGTSGNVLYTGDFRLGKGDTHRIRLLHSNGSVKEIKSVYVDTTFCLPQMMTIPTRKETKDAIVRVIDRWFSRGADHVISLQCKGMYGYEYLLKEIALHYKTKIHISQERLSLYQYLTDMAQYFTTDGKATKLHSCNWKSSKGIRSTLPCGSVLSNGLVPRVLRVKPTTMWFARRTEPLPTDHTKYCRDKRMWRVVHSMHASMEEVRDLVGYLRPYHVYPNVEPAGLYTIDDAWHWLKDLTRIDECNSCNQEDSGHDRFMAMATQFQAPDSGTVLKPHRQPVLRSTPSESVAATYKELGLEDECALAPLPVKRRRKLGNKNSTADGVSDSKGIEEIAPSEGARLETTGSIDAQIARTKITEEDSDHRKEMGEGVLKNKYLTRSKPENDRGLVYESLACRNETVIETKVQPQSLSDECCDNDGVCSIYEVSSASNATEYDVTNKETRVRVRLEENAIHINARSPICNGGRDPSKKSKMKLLSVSELNESTSLGNAFEASRNRSDCKASTTDSVNDCKNIHQSDVDVTEAREGVTEMISCEVCLNKHGKSASLEGNSASYGNTSHSLSLDNETFNIPPSPGQATPSLEVLSALHKRLQSGESIATKSLFFG